LAIALTVSVDVTNTGARAGDEVAQVYLTDLEGSTSRPLRFLAGFARVSLQPGETKTLSFTITPEQMSMVNAQGAWVVEPGEFLVAVGGSQRAGLSERFEVTR